MIMSQQQTVRTALGSMIFVLAGSSLIEGMSQLQAYIYYHRFQCDNLFSKISTGCLCILDLFHLVLIVHAAYYYVVINFGDTAGLSESVFKAPSAHECRDCL